MKKNKKKPKQRKSILSNPWLLLLVAGIATALYAVIVDGTGNLFQASVAIAIKRFSVAVVVVFGWHFIARLFSAPKVAQPALASMPNIDKRSDMLPEPVHSTDTLASIAGYQQVKESIGFIVRMLSDPTVVENANIPKGLLLYGPPGTGKTMFARAIAGEVDVPFFSVNASQFTDRWVGQGARNVRNLYAAARQHPVSVVFIDEIDAIGTSRGGTGENQEARQTLNALLSELDGFGKDGPIVLTIAATNDYEHLDSALIRPGRFDRKILIPMPNKVDRVAILEHYTRDKGFSSDIDLEQLALMTATFSCAMLSTLVNEAVIAATAKKHKLVLWSDIDTAMTRVITDGEPIYITDPHERHVTAVHEAGHALAGKVLLGQTIAKTTIIGSTSGIMGWTLRTDSEDSVAPITKQQLEDSIVALYAGKAAEELSGYAPSAGCKADLDKASDLIQKYFLEYRFGGPLVNIGGDSLLSNGLSTAAQQLATRLYQKAVDTLKSYNRQWLSIAEALLDKESLTDKDINEIMANY